MRSKDIEIGGLIYRVYENGDVYSSNGIVKQRPNTSGYATFTAGKHGQRRSVTTHLLVARLFLPNPNNFPEVDHLDANRMNPNLNNLDWVTHQENIRRAKERGSYEGRIKGEKNPKAKLSESIVLQLIDEYRKGVSIQEMVVKYGYPWSTISNAVKGVTWSYLQ